MYKYIWLYEYTGFLSHLKQNQAKYKNFSWYNWKWINRNYLLKVDCKSLTADGKNEDVYLSLFDLIERGLPDLSEKIIWLLRGCDLSFKILKTFL